MVFIYPTTKPALKTAITVLTAALSADVSAAMPRTIGSSPFVRIERIGGTRPNVVTDEAVFLIHCFGTTPEVVETLCSAVDEAMHNAISTVVDEVYIRDWKDVGGPVNLVHPDFLNLERWQMTGTLCLGTTIAVDP